MTDLKPLTEQQLTDIETRTNAATSGPWERFEEYGPHFYANITGPYLRGVGDLNFGVGEQAEADEVFVRHAAEDVAVLVAEVRRLHAHVAEMQPDVDLLAALRAYGVDNWDGYDEAIQAAESASS